MSWLCIETATVACAIALDDGVVVTERILDRERRHTEALVPGIRELLAERSVTVNDLEGVIVDRGPGLFTGLRVGLATAAALAQSRGCALVGVTSLEVLAEMARTCGHYGRVTAMVDARRGEVFAQSFALDDEVVALDEPVVGRAVDLVARGRITDVVTGDGAHRYRDALEDRLVLADTVPSPAAARALARDRPDQRVVAPLYLREADAVANFATRERS